MHLTTKVSWKVLNKNISNSVFFMQLRVEVSDVNDNAPVCVSQPDIQLDRSVPVGEYVGSLKVR